MGSLAQEVAQSAPGLNTLPLRRRIRRDLLWLEDLSFSAFVISWLSVPYDGFSAGGFPEAFWG
jgi:hypothetical protein